MPKYLFLQRSQPRSLQPSPAQMQDMYAAFNAWKEKFKDNILDMGAPFKPGGTVVTKTGATEDALTEIKKAGKTTLHYLTDADRKAWQEAMRPTYTWAKGRVGQEVLDLVAKELDVKMN